MTNIAVITSVHPSDDVRILRKECGSLVRGDTESSSLPVAPGVMSRMEF